MHLDPQHCLKIEKKKQRCGANVFLVTTGIRYCSGSVMIADENGFALQYFAIRITGISYNILSCNINLKSFISQLLLYKNIQPKNYT